MDEDTTQAAMHQREQEEQQMMTNHFAELAAIDCSRYIEKKGKFSYLSWAWAVDQLLRRDPDASWEYAEPTTFPDGTMMVVCTVTAFGKPRRMQLPVMDGSNKPVANPNAYVVNTAMQRCLVKAIALHGLGLSIYAGEDVPRTDDGEKAMNAEQQTALQELRDAALNGIVALQTQWKAKPEAIREALKDELPALKKAAVEAEKKAA